MDDAARAREAARDSLDDVEPEPLRTVIHDRLADVSMVPAVMAIRCARAVAPDAESGSDPDSDVALDSDAVDARAAGVQLIYEGLRLTRRLAHEEPWVGADLDADLDADVEIIAADVLVSRGFYLLARTPAAGRAVGVVRAFGRDQTERRSAVDPTALDRNLEADVLALAAVAGTTVAGGDPPPELVSFAADLGRDLAGDPERGFPTAAATLDGPAGDRVSRLATGGDPKTDADVDPVTRSATDP